MVTNFGLFLLPLQKICEDRLRLSNSSELDCIRLALSLHTVMNKVRKESYRVRAISVGFAVLALAAFKPFGLGALHWQAYVHLLVMWILGVGVCLLTEAILRFIVRIPRSLEQGATYIIRRNLWFQLINTPFVSLMICLYRHFLLSDHIPANRLSWGNFFETFIIFTFISFAIGLYWRYKYRSRFLTEELEETKVLNEQLKVLQRRAEQRAKEAEQQINTYKKSQETSSAEGAMPTNTLAVSETITLTGTTSESVSLHLSNLLYIEAVGNYVKVYHLRDGLVRTDMLRATSKQLEDNLCAYPMIVRCHRAFLVNLGQVEQIISHSGSMQLVIRHCQESIPVSRSNMAQVKNVIKQMDKG